MGIGGAARTHARKEGASGPSWRRLLGAGLFVAGWALIAWNLFSE